MGSDPTTTDMGDIMEPFQSTLPHGERLSQPSGRRCSPMYFNPRSRMGSDIFRYVTCNRYGISIHAPAWGATLILSSVESSPFNFNPRSRMGSDGVIRLPTRTYSLFQSTLPHGERPLGWGYYALSDYFNPRSRMGSDMFTSLRPGVSMFLFNCLLRF